MQKFIARGAAALAGVVLAAGAQAQAYPSRTVRFIVPFSPGGTTDVIARVVATSMGKALGQPVIVENRPGAGGNIGADAVAKAAPDGYTLGIVGNSFTVNPSLYATMPYRQAELQPVALLAEVPFILESSTKSSFRSVPELLAQAAARPGKLTYASGGSGTIGHLGMHWFTEMAKVSMTHVPYKGAAPAVTDVMGGQVDVFLDTLTVATPLIAANKVRPLMVTSRSRLPAAPDVPTAAELGFPQFTISAWIGMVAPAATPQPVLDRIGDAVNQSLRSEDVVRALAAVGAQGRPGPRAAAVDFMHGEEKRWANVVHSSGARVE